MGAVPGELGNAERQATQEEPELFPGLDHAKLCRVLCLPRGWTLKSFCDVAVFSAPRCLSGTAPGAQYEECVAAAVPDAGSPDSDAALGGQAQGSVFRRRVLHNSAGAVLDDAWVATPELRPEEHKGPRGRAGAKVAAQAAGVRRGPPEDPDTAKFCKERCVDKMFSVFRTATRTKYADTDATGLTQNLFFNRAEVLRLCGHRWDQAPPPG